MSAPPTSHAERSGPAPLHPDGGPAQPDPGEVERFQPGGVLHALSSGLLEAALASVLLGLSLQAGEGTATSLAAAALLWVVLAAYSLAVAGLRARVWAAELDRDGVVLRRLGGARRWRYDQLSAVEIGRGHTRLVDRDGRAHRVRGVRGSAQARRFRARVLARATEAAGRGEARWLKRASPPGDRGDEGAGPPAPTRAEG